MTRQPTTRDMFELLLLSGIWGSSFLFLRIASPVFGPVFLIEMRVLSALAVLLPLCLYLGKQNDIINNWRNILFLSLTNMSVPFCLLAFATLSITAGLASVLNATVPFFAALFAFIFWSQRLSKMAVLGMVIGFVGVIVLVLDPSSASPISGNLIAILAAILACSLYGLAANITAQRLQGISGVAVTTGSLLMASICLAPFAIWQRPEVMPTGPIWLSVIALGVLCTGFAYVLFYRLLTRIGPHKTLSTTFLLPVFSILWGKLFLAESITLFMVIGGILILLGVGFTTERIPKLSVLFGSQANLAKLEED